MKNQGTSEKFGRNPKCELDWINIQREKGKIKIQRKKGNKKEVKVQREKGNKSPNRKGKIKVQRKKGNRSPKRKGKKRKEKSHSQDHDVKSRSISIG